MYIKKNRKIVGIASAILHIYPFVVLEKILGNVTCSVWYQLGMPLTLRKMLLCPEVCYRVLLGIVPYLYSGLLVCICNVSWYGNVYVRDVYGDVPYILPPLCLFIVFGILSLYVFSTVSVSLNRALVYVC